MRLILTVRISFSFNTESWLINENSLDLVLSINGLPVATMELKNQFTGQNVKNAKWQYMNDRDAKELIFSFKKTI